MKAFLTIPALGGLFGALILVPVIWLFAPALLGIEALWLLGLLAALPVLVWLAVMLVVVQRRRKREAGLIAGVTAADTAAAKDKASAEAASAEEQAVSARLAEALGALKTAGGGKGGYLYERPWYVIIGPPGSGKTTAIENSGLNFPLSAGRVKGVGGTRNCDWWIAEQAVLIDTAGRYTTQDSDAQADKAGWERFLELLKRQRPKQPLNGVVVAFGADMISRLDAAQRDAHAQTVRNRIRELEQKLGQRLPVYFVVSKADLIVGFSEFFDDLDKETRAQVWGVTFPEDAGPDGHAAKLPAEFAALTQRLQDRLLERLQAERGPEQRARIGGFPAQFASLEAPLQAFVTAAFGGSKLDPAPFLRGIYFTSGTQEGTPIDRLTGALSRAFGLDPRRPASVMGQKGRSYFLGRLLRDVVFGEARLAARDRGQAKRGRLVQAGAWAAALLLLIGGGAWGYAAMNAEATRRANLQAAIARAEQAAQGLPLDRITAEDELLRVIPYLDATRALPAAARAEGVGLGLSQEAKLVEAGDLSYERALDRVLLPRLLARLENQIRAGMQRPEFLYEATRIYLMLGRAGPMDRALVQEWMTLDWQQAFPGAVGTPVRDALSGHLQALLATDFSRYALDGALVDQARRIFSRLPMAERIYSRLRTAANNAPPWKPGDAMGVAGQRWFATASGRPIAELAVPGLFTVDGLHKALLPQLPRAILEAASESWVLGAEAATAMAGDPRQLEAAVLRLYAEDYARAWQAMLADIVLPPFRNLHQAAEALNLLGAPNSPLRDVLRGAARQLSPGTPPEAPAAAATEAAQAAAASTSRLAAAVGAALQPSSAAPVATIVEERFRPLREVAGQPLDAILAIVNELYVQVARVVSSPPGTVIPPSIGLDPGQRLAAEAQRAPEPLSRWLNTLSLSTATARSGGARAAIAAAGGAALAPFCRGLETRFPFRQTLSAADTPYDDFVRLFGPGGVFDQFFAQHLRNFVDTTQNPWRPVAADGLVPPVTQADLRQFQRAAAIRDAFWPAGIAGAAMGLRFELVPLGIDPGATGAVLEVEGNRVVLAGEGATSRPIPMQWPARGGITLTFDPPSSAGPLATDGAWAAMRLVSRGRLTTTRAADRLRLTLQHGERRAEFELRASSIVHPFGLRELQDFRCPALAP
ncbi:type VI secretion system membrane subunit TssM [Roseomonas frigidaquae]|uniref:Type VI secretion system membrane subunit TssM n=1 Tax=Falsiroseomonas frigidaquae TaxID=487318 RepID=A0ABX1F3K0_9PROT|nr:type VI secretion system membrane subunit TssM [Falsiroseomonas frigidaquae]NKE46920.1 type VI secretion system membrane subunit TssM [Falsiroseomonas frigidaquae]